MPDELRKRYLKTTGPTNEVEQELADIYNAAIRKKDSKELRWIHDAYQEEKPLEFPARPPAFRAEGLNPPHIPESRYDKESPWEFIGRIAPEVKDSYRRMQIGPTKGVMEELGKDELGFEAYPYSNLLGLHDSDFGEISVNPSIAKDRGYWGRDDFDATVAHETGHAAGISHGRKMNNIEGLMIMAREAERRKDKRWPKAY